MLLLVNVRFLFYKLQGFKLCIEVNLESYKEKCSPGLFSLVVRASAQEPEGQGFNSWSRAWTSIADLIPSPDQGTNGRQPIEVSLPHQCFSFSLPLFPTFHSV